MQRPLFAESIFLQCDAGQPQAARHHFFYKAQTIRTPFWMTALRFSSLSARITLP